MDSYRGTDEYKKRTEEWKSRRKNSQNVEDISKVPYHISQINHDTTNVNDNSTNSILDKILMGIDRMTANIAYIKNILKQENQDDMEKPPLHAESRVAPSDQSAEVVDTRTTLKSDP